MSVETRTFDLASSSYSMSLWCSYVKPKKSNQRDALKSELQR